MFTGAPQPLTHHHLMTWVLEGEHKYPLITSAILVTVRPYTGYMRLSRIRFLDRPGYTAQSGSFRIRISEQVLYPASEPALKERVENARTLGLLPATKQDFTRCFRDTPENIGFLVGFVAVGNIAGYCRIIGAPIPNIQPPLAPEPPPRARPRLVVDNTHHQSA